MWLQAVVAIDIILFVTFGGDAASTLFTFLIDMMNISSPLIDGGFPVL